jgi:ubiquinone biosynthesis protein UbiJ
MNPLLIVALSAPIEGLINAVIAQDVGSQRRLAALEGKSVQLQCSKPVAFSVYMLVLNARLSVRALQEEAPSAGIKADAGALLRMLLGGGQSGALFSPDVQLSGDTHVVQALHAILGGLNIDWEAHLARLFGDVATQQFSTAMANAREWTAQTQESLRADLEEYVHEEARLLPSGAETRIFAERLDELKLGLDRIQARAARLRQNVADQAPGL